MNDKFIEVDIEIGDFVTWYLTVIIDKVKKHTSDQNVPEYQNVMPPTLN